MAVDNWFSGPWTTRVPADPGDSGPVDLGRLWFRQIRTTRVPANRATRAPADLTTRVPGVAGSASGGPGWLRFPGLDGSGLRVRTARALGEGKTAREEVW